MPTLPLCNGEIVGYGLRNASKHFRCLHCGREFFIGEYIRMVSNQHTLVFSEHETHASEHHEEKYAATRV